MSLLADHQILYRCQQQELPMIEPFIEKLVQPAKISYGPSSYGYDLRLGGRFGMYKPSDVPLDPANVKPEDLEWFEANADGVWVLPARGFCLATTMEYLRMPDDVTGFIADKSTYARCAIHGQNTIIEAGFEGQITLEIVNYIDRPVILRAGQGIVQMLFDQGDSRCTTSYRDRGGKYQGQRGVTLPCLKGNVRHEVPEVAA